MKRTQLLNIIIVASNLTGRKINRRKIIALNLGQFAPVTVRVGFWLPLSVLPVPASIRVPFGEAWRFR
jgi:hypothetical protein